MTETNHATAEAILAAAFDALVDAGLDPIVVAVEMACTALREMPDAACCRTCLVHALREVGEELDAQHDALLEDVDADAQPAEERVH